ncbi:hypothetical protein HanXRQr2_Chr07g0296371 [Helianthus annuus]|uniref:Uncharacterized protein n=1 Tax=Helianthus annuus TaxID=4232 RepID=A0A9K3IKR6_HELAN|nr:hypothetical protein HanXRQr2_Chr07g0296371 [Helianthus annuus]KAJ0904833.1 hypothetical protein HanPSC8_Chr07g0286911 [Helianthus annuus]
MFGSTFSFCFPLARSFFDLASVGMMQTHLMSIARIGSVLASDNIPDPRKH